MTNRFALALCSAFVAGVGSAFAADLPRKAPMAVPAAAPVYNWTGFYVGVHAGWGFTETDSSMAFLPSPAAAGINPIAYSHDTDGFLAGGQIGFNYQIANLVIGLEADISWADINGGATVAPLTTFVGGFPIPGSSHTSSYDMNWFGTVRGRVGFAANSLLVYVTGGLAYADIDYTTVFAIPAVALFTGATSETKAGWTIGGGFEWGFTPNWSLKAEYLYYDLGDTTVIGLDPVLNPGFATSTTFDNAGHILRVGLNYRFGWGGPVVARY